MVDSCMGDKRNTQDINCGGLRKDTTCYSWLMGDKRNTQDINCGGLRKDTEFYSWLTVVCETKEIHKI